MSDIRKDFEKWYGDDGLAQAHPLSAEIKEARWESYQAGRAHDVDGLIAEINSLDIFHGCIRKEDVNLLIRKHFGKE